MFITDLDGQRTDTGSNLRGGQEGEREAQPDRIGHRGGDHQGAAQGQAERGRDRGDPVLDKGDEERRPRDPRGAERCLDTGCSHTGESSGF